MINRQDILDRAAEWQLRPEVVEKDYVLGWVLAAIATHPVTSSGWAFKGGTCLKKCFFETYRFSEDLDFTLELSTSYTENALREILRDVAQSAEQLSGAQVPEDQIRIESIAGPGERLTFQGRIYYRGPLGRGGTLSRILLDLTRHETVVAPVVVREVFHPYPDALPAGTTVRSYSLIELLAEKTRALFERTRPRDLYDVIYIIENHAEQLDLDQTRECFRAKCRYKQLVPPPADALIDRVLHTAELRAEWANMLGHQLPTLPPVESILDRQRLSTILSWIDAPVVLAVTSLQPTTGGFGEELIAPAGIRFWGAGSVIEKLRFAGANRLMVEFLYGGRRRHVEPYSLRRARTGNLLFYGWEREEATIKSYNVNRVSSLSVTSVVFSPRYRIELSSAEPLQTPPARVGARNRPRTRRRRFRT